MGIIWFPLFSSGLKYFFFIQSVCVFLSSNCTKYVWVLMCIFGRNKMCVVEITFVFYVLPFLFGYYSLQHLSSLVTHKKMWFQCYILRKKDGENCRISEQMWRLSQKYAFSKNAENRATLHRKSCIF